MRTRLWAEVSLEAIAANFRLLSARYGEVAAVVKANAYGHGLVPVARACVSAGATRLCVATLPALPRLFAPSDGFLRDWQELYYRGEPLASYVCSGGSAMKIYLVASTRIGGKT